MPPEPISDADWRWLKDNYVDFVLEEPAYAPKLLALRDTRLGTTTDRNALIDYSKIHETGAAGRGQHQVRAIYSAKGVAADIARTKIPETLGSREQDGEIVT